MNTKLFIDLDGVLLGKARPADTEITLAKHAREFLEYCVQNYECYWLTTHCRDGDTTRVVNTLRRYADEHMIALIRRIRPTAWKTLKTEAIDFESDFYLIDDQLLRHEIGLLEKKGVLGRWLKVDTRRNPDDLKRATSVLRARAVYQEGLRQPRSARSNLMFVGVFLHAIDGKRRLAVPLRFRREPGARRGLVVVPGSGPCLVCYAAAECHIRADCAAPVQLDRLGRILIPRRLAEYARLQRTAVIVGLDDRFEIRDANAWHTLANNHEDL